jgi:septation ring formation regulator EzrA
MVPVGDVGMGVAIFSVVSTLAAVIYVRGKIDTQLEHTTENLKLIKLQIAKLESTNTKDAEERGVQRYHNQNVQHLQTATSNNDKLLARIEARQTAHEEGCDKRQVDIEHKLDRIDDRIENMSAEIRNLALGIANTLTSVPPTQWKGLPP